MPDTNFDSINVAGALNVAGAMNQQSQDVVHLAIAGVQTTGTNKAMALMPVAGTIVGIRAYALTPPTGATLILDVNKNGTTLFTTQANRPTIAIAGNASSLTLPDVTAVAAGDRITVDVDQIGSGTAGSDVMVAVTIKRALAA